MIVHSDTGGGDGMHVAAGLATYQRAYPPLPLAQAPPCLSTRARLTVVFPTALLGFLLWTLPSLSTGTRLTVVFLTFSVLAQGGGGVSPAQALIC